MSDEEQRLFKGPDGAGLRFFYKPMKNNFISEKEGRPVYDKCLMLEIMTPGSNESMPLIEMERDFCEQAALPTRINAEKCQQYHEALASFKAGNFEATLQGTPLSQWPPIDIALAETLKGIRIHTVEQLAQVQDVHLKHIGTGGRALRAQAQAFVQSSQSPFGSAEVAAKLSHAEEENTRLKADMAAMNANMTQMQTELAALRAGMPATTAPADTTFTAAPPPAADPFAQQGGGSIV